jgi:hypothetical protein
LPVKLPTGGSITATLVQVQKGEGVFLLTAATLPAERIASASAAQILADSQAGSLANTGGTLVTEKEITVGGFPGRDFLAKATANGQQGRVRTRVVLVKDKQFQLVYAAADTGYSESDAESFVASLKLTN